MAAYFSKAGLKLADGCLRIVHGGRGSYYEFDRSQLQWGAFQVPEEQKYRLSEKWRKLVYYIEHRSVCAANVKLYEQLKPVGYADYKVGLFYISIYDLIEGTHEENT